MKMNRNKLLFLLFLSAAFSFSVSAYAASPGENPATAYAVRDFENVYRLDADRDGGLYRVRLDNEIYEAIRQSVNRDLAIFDSSGAPLPFEVRRVEHPYESDGVSGSGSGETAEFRIPAFPMPQGDYDGADLGDIVIRTDQGGRVIEIRGSNNPTERKSSRFLLDISPLFESGRAIGRCGIDIPLDDSRSVAATADIYASPNLRDWRKVVEGEPLISLRGDGGVLKSGYIEIVSSLASQAKNADIGRYLMLDVSGGTLPENFVDFTVAFKAAKAHIPDRIASFGGSAEPSGKSFVYDLKGFFPLHEVKFTLESPGVYSANIEYRGSASDEWRRLARTTLYFTRNAGGESVNEAIKTQIGQTRQRARYFRLSFTDGNLSVSSAPPAPPKLQIAWRPQEVVFMAQGEPPYLLACGSAKDAPSLARPDLIGRVLASHPSPLLEASIAERVSGASVPPPEEAEAAETKKAWQQYMVWGVLISGAMFFSWAAWTLIRRDGKKDNNKDAEK